MDEQYIEDLVSGTLKRPDSWWPEIDHREVSTLPPGDFAVVSFPAGAHADDDVAWLNRELSHLDEVVLFVTSDEASRFPVHLIKHRRMHLWVMEPRPEIAYPSGTQFIGCGSARAGRLTEAPLRRVTPLSFAGQINHARREQMLAGSALWPLGSVCEITDGFLAGSPREEYLAQMAGSRVVACPAGVQSQDSFRLHEALDLGCVPLADALRPDGGGSGYWDLVMPSAPFPKIKDWSDSLKPFWQDGISDYPWTNVRCHSWWHQFRRHLARCLRNQFTMVSGSTMTVVIPTSPIPSHPSTEILEATVGSVRERTDAEILIMCDGVRPEQWDMRPEYGAYLQQVCSLAERWDNVTPLYFAKFFHQAEMLRRTLQLVESEYVLFVEHDTPLVGETDFESLIRTIEAYGLNCMRLYHEVAIHPEHEHLMLEFVLASNPFRKTMQWSQRPHLARRDWYEQILADFFDRDARTMIEDVMVGPTEGSLLLNGGAGWDDWRMAIYEPAGNIQRSTHLDGRAGEPKFEMKYRYPNGKPPAGAPMPNRGI